MQEARDVLHSCFGRPKPVTDVVFRLISAVQYLLMVLLFCNTLKKYSDHVVGIIRNAFTCVFFIHLIHLVSDTVYDYGNVLDGQNLLHDIIDTLDYTMIYYVFFLNMFKMKNVQIYIENYQVQDKVVEKYNLKWKIIKWVYIIVYTIDVWA